VPAISRAYEEKWPSFVAALSGTGPVGIHHEVPAGSPVTTESQDAHNVLMTFAYVLARASFGRQRISMLDWGGGIGHYYAIARALLPELTIDYHVHDVPTLCAHGRRLFPEATFDETESCLERRYDLVMASNSLQYSERWQQTVRGLAAAADGFLYLTRTPIVWDGPSFVVVQRAYAYGYDTQYLGWVLNRSELIAEVEAAGRRMEREFVVLGPFEVHGAPQSVFHRGWLFRA